MKGRPQAPKAHMPASSPDSSPGLFDHEAGGATARAAAQGPADAQPAEPAGGAAKKPSAGRAAKGAAAPRRTASAEELASRQRDISVAEFFTKNRHLLGFDSPLKALLTAIKEAVDNSLDACEEAGVLPEIGVEIHATDNENRFRIAIEDNGPGIVRDQVGKVFGKLLYGSKFHKLSQTRGQQGIGIAAAGMYGQLTTGKPMRILSRPGAGAPPAA